MGTWAEALADLQGLGVCRPNAAASEVGTQRTLWSWMRSWHRTLPKTFPAHCKGVECSDFAEVRCSFRPRSLECLRGERKNVRA